MNLTTGRLEKYLGKSATVILADAPFRDWKFEKSFESDVQNPRVDYVFPENGLDFIRGVDDQVRTIFLYSDGKRSFEGGLVDLPFSSTRNDVRGSFGVPSKSGGLIDDPVLGQFGPWDRFTRSGYSIHVEYEADVESIKKITIMRAEVVP